MARTIRPRPTDEEGDTDLLRFPEPPSDNSKCNLRRVRIFDRVENTCSMSDVPVQSRRSGVCVCVFVCVVGLGGVGGGGGLAGEQNPGRA